MCIFCNSKNNNNYVNRLLLTFVYVLFFVNCYFEILFATHFTNENKIIYIKTHKKLLYLCIEKETSIQKYVERLIRDDIENKKM